MAAEIVSGYDYLSTEQLMVARPVGDEPHRLDRVRVPQAPAGEQYLTPLRRSNYGTPWHEHIYSGEPDSSPLHKTHLILNELTTGERKPLAVSTDLRRVARDIASGAGDSEFTDLAARVETIDSLYLDGMERRRRKIAEDLGRTVGSSRAYICARSLEETYDGAWDIFTAKVIGLLSLRQGKLMGYEPVVSTPAGTGLMPPDMYLYQGLYVPTVDQ